MSNPKPSYRIRRRRPLVAAKDANKVIVLGAGASAADGAPLQANLFGKYAEIIRNRGHDIASNERDADIHLLFHNLWGIDFEKKSNETQSFPTFEEVLGVLELASARGEYFKGFGGLQPETTRAHRLRAHLISLIAVVLEHSLHHAADAHRHLGWQLRELKWIKNTSFLSLNYDIMIDNVLRGVSGTEPDYGVQFRSISNGHKPLPDPPILLKLHGSLNWLYCPTCSALDLYPGEKIVAEIAHSALRLPCPVCQETRASIVIPPTFFKVMSNFYLQQIWKKSEEVLRDADHLIFCGYSFPDADLHFKYLLKRAEINRSGRLAKPLEVFIINEHKGKTAEASESEHNRYLRFFARKELVHWTTLSFEDFSANPKCYADAGMWK